MKYILMFKGGALLAGVFVFSTISFSSIALADTVIDDFDTGPQMLVVHSGNPSETQTFIGSPTNLIGGSRNVDLQHTDGPVGDIQLEVNTSGVGLLHYSEASGADGRFMLLYDGNGAGLFADLTLGGNDHLVISVLGVNQPNATVDIQITDTFRGVSFANNILHSGINVIPLSSFGGFADFTQIQNIQFIFDQGPEAATNFAIDVIKASGPISPLTVSTVENGYSSLLGFIDIGDKVLFEFDTHIIAPPITGFKNIVVIPTGLGSDDKKKLVDNGTHGDEIAGDGVYSGVFVVPILGPQNPPVANIVLKMGATTTLLPTIPIYGEPLCIEPLETVGEREYREAFRDLLEAEKRLQAARMEEERTKHEEERAKTEYGHTSFDEKNAKADYKDNPTEENREKLERAKEANRVAKENLDKARKAHSQAMSDTDKAVKEEREAREAAEKAGKQLTYEEREAIKAEEITRAREEQCIVR